MGEGWEVDGLGESSGIGDGGASKKASSAPPLESISGNVA